MDKVKIGDLFVASDVRNAKHYEVQSSIVGEDGLVRVWNPKVGEISIHISELRKATHEQLLWSIQHPRALCKKIYKDPEEDGV